MRVRYLGNRVRGDMAKLGYTMFIEERFPTLSSQYNIQRSKRFASVGIAFLCLAFVEQRTNDTDECLRRNGGTGVWVSKYFFKPTGNPRPARGTVVDEL